MEVKNGPTRGTRPELITLRTPLGPIAEVAPGQFEFLDSEAGDYPTRYYRLRSPCSPATSQPTVAAVTRQPDQRLLLQCAATAGLTYTLQTSTNLVNWVDHTNVVADPGGVIECLTDMETNAPARFYRLRWP